MSEPVEEDISREATSPSKRKGSFDSKDSLCGIRGDRSIVYSENWEEKEAPVPVFTVIEYLLREQDRAVHPSSKRYKEGWSPTCNGSTEAFFTNFQESFISWSKQWPNTRIPRLYQTPRCELLNCIQIEVDLERDSLVDESTREVENILTSLRGAVTSLRGAVICGTTRSTRAVNNSTSKQVPPCTSTLNTRSERLAYWEALVQIEEEKEELVVGRTICLPNQHPDKVWPRVHYKFSYNNFHHLINEPPEDQSLQRQLEVDAQIIEHYYTYVNNKGRRLYQVKPRGIDKTSDNYIPHSTVKVNYGASYCIKVIDNTFVNNILGTVGFTICEYFGHVALEEEEEDTEPAILPVVGVGNNTYNIVQVVHGVYFTKGVQVRSHNLYGLSPRLTSRIKSYNRAYYNSDTNSWASEEVLTTSTFHIIRTVINNTIIPSRDIQYIKAVPHNGTPVRKPRRRTSSFLKQQYRLYRLHLGSLKIDKFKVYKNIFPASFNSHINHFDSNTPVRPVNITDNHELKLRYWRFKQLIIWTLLQDLPETEQEIKQVKELFPTFKIDFYNVNYLITRK
jgi:hypothetical protein